MSSALKSKGLKTQSAILNAAETEFAEHGYQASSLRRIAKEANIEVPGLYKYFKNKDELYKTAIERALSPIEQILDKATQSKDLSHIAALPSAMIDCFADNLNRAKLFQQVLGRPNPDKQLEDSTQALIEKGINIMDRASLGKFSRSEITIIVSNLFSLYTGFFTSTLYNPSDKAALQAQLTFQKALVDNYIRSIVSLSTQQGK